MRTRDEYERLRLRMPFAGLQLGGVNAAELTSLLRSHFGMSLNESGKKIIFQRGMNNPCLSLTFDKSWHVLSATRHLGMSDQDAIEINQKIDSELRRSDGIYVFRDFLFYTVAVDKAHRFSDIFQFFPVPLGAARPDALRGPHPFVIEVSVPAGSNPFTNADRGRLKATKIKNILTVLLQYNVSAIPASTQHVWVFENAVGSPPVNLRQVLYTCVDPNWRPDQFTDISNFLPPKITDPNQYYLKYGITGDASLELPSNFEDQFQRYFAFDEKDQQRFERACYWYAHAYEVWSLSKSACYVALVTAIECMLEATPAGPPCVTCGKAATDGPTRQFREFIETHVPEASGMASVKKELYKLRSQMVHGSCLMSNDIGSWRDPRNASEDTLHRQLMRVVQLALVNWLASG